VRAARSATPCLSFAALLLPAQALENLDHRGAVGSDGLTGDGVGILTQVPHLFFRKKLRSRGVDVAADSDLAVGVFFFPGTGGKAGGPAPGTPALMAVVDAALAEAGIEKLMWRTVRFRRARALRGAARRRAGSPTPPPSLLCLRARAGAHWHVLAGRGRGAQPARHSPAGGAAAGGAAGRRRGGRRRL
jgi:hypothetical protein